MNKRKHSILQINTYGIAGGAGKAAYRLHNGLLRIGQHSRYLVKEIRSSDPTIFTAEPDIDFEEKLKTDHLINKYYIWFNRTGISNTYFSFSYPGFNLSRSRLVHDADIINLHWVEDFLSPKSLSAMFSLNKPVVWTLHDQKPFTGGCHYSAGCKNYQERCHHCPQLLDDPFGLPTAILKDKMELFKGADLTVVTPSSWLAKEAGKSSLFKSNRIEVVPNSIETDIYYPIEKKAAKNRLGIDPNTVTIMFGTADAREERKGLKKLISAMYNCMQDKTFNKFVDSNKVLILSVGITDESIKNLPISVKDFGYIENDHDMAKVYNASDMLILPSLEDNLPNTMLEAMACGTPVISFNTGGMPDVIVDDVNGKLVENQDSVQLGKAIADMVFHSSKRKSMSEESSALIRTKYKLKNQAEKYLNLYDDLLRNRSSRKTNLIAAEGPYGSHTRMIYEDLLQYAINTKKQMEN